MKGQFIKKPLGGSYYNVDKINYIYAWEMEKDHWVIMMNMTDKYPNNYQHFTYTDEPYFKTEEQAQKWLDNWMIKNGWTNK